MPYVSLNKTNAKGNNRQFSMSYIRILIISTYKYCNNLLTCLNIFFSSSSFVWRRATGTCPSFYLITTKLNIDFDYIH
jgi:hypothetical protein